MAELSSRQSSTAGKLVVRAAKEVGVDVKEANVSGDILPSGE